MNNEGKMHVLLEFSKIHRLSLVGSRMIWSLMVYIDYADKLNFINNFIMFLKILCTSGGAELLFNNKKKFDVMLPGSDKPWTIKNLLKWIKDNLLEERPELFIQKDSVRPGILVLVNDADWELLGALEYEVQPNDRIMFISTLHGG